MTLWQRVILLLLALPTSTGLAAGLYWALDLPTQQGLAVAAAVFIACELLLQQLASRIPPIVGVECMPGREVEVISDFESGEQGSYVGHVRIQGERWKARVARSEGVAPRRGTRARVERVDGLTLWVTPLSR
ncbi:MAG: hypothetical protein A3G24_04885 [Betaproteobacteria bacterium RIFCSPLOWO2_12_FULL_62_13]|nr:MAG: hypothetical protein A3G24_04885 [Betaproteobacteria bacterium RIFCSPLOWO2_12_FULL_62_13]